MAVEEKAAFVLLSGDVFDGEWRDYKTGLFFVDQMARLGRAGIRVFVLRGNHDPASRSKTLRFPQNVHEFGSRRAGTERIPEIGVAIHGRSFPEGAVTEDLSATYPDPVSGLLNVGMLHTSLSGRPGHAPYAPCTADGLAAKGYDYWALGHVHQREVVRESPHVVFPGNLQGRHVRETGSKGCSLVTVEDGRIAAVEHRPLCVLRWAVRDVDAGGAATPDDVLGRVREAIDDEVRRPPGCSVAVRVRVLGACPAHPLLVRDAARWREEVRAVATDAGRGDAWVEKVQIATRSPLDLDEMERRDDALGGLLRRVRAIGGDAGSLAALAPELEDLRQKLPHDLACADDPLRLDDPAYLRQAIEIARDILATRLHDRGDDR